MKRLFTALFALAILFPATVFAGGIVTNTNQSASFIRNPSQDAFLGIEGVYYNPAGLIHLDNGFYISLSNQTVSQTRDIKSSFAMNQQEFKGTVSAPLFPTFYAVYKKDKVAYSFGFNPIGGGGSADFQDGLPSFEQQVAVLPAMLTASGIPTSQYSVKSSFQGSSIYYGFQVNGTYAVNEMFSFSLGFRYIIANNSNQGYLKDVMINPNYPLFGTQYNGSSLVSAPQFFTDGSTVLTGYSNQFLALFNGANLFITNLSPLADDYGTFNINSVVTDATQLAQLATILGAAGYTDISGMDLNTVLAILNGAAPQFNATAQNLAGQATVMRGYASATSDKEVDADQNGFGISPIIGINMKFSEKLNVALKYEYKADMMLTNKTLVDDVKMFPNGAKTPNDMPSMLAIGIGFKPIEKLNLSGGMHMYFDKGANYGKKLNGLFVENSEVIDKNSIEVALGAEFMVTDKILVSAGYLLTQTGANDKFHSDLSHSLNTNSVGLGGKIMVNENIGVNLGFMTTMYQGLTKSFTGYTEEYNRSAMVFALGFDYKF